MNRVFFKLKSRKASPEERASLYIRQYDVRAGKGCLFYGDVDFGSEPYLIKFGDHVMLSDNVRFSTHDGGMQVLSNMGLLPNADNFGRITIGNNVFIGMNALVLKGVTVGDNVVVGAGAVVTGDLPGDAVYAGVPAKRICSIAEYCQKAKLTYDATFGMSPERKREYLAAKYNLRSEG